MPRRLRSGLLAGLLFISSFAWAQQPARFTIQPGKTATFSTRVEATGALKISLESRNAPLRLLVTDVKKRRLHEVQAVQQPHADITVSLTDTSLVGRHLLITLVPTNANVAVTGSIAVTRPTPTAPKVRVQIRESSSSQSAALDRKMQAAMAAKVAAGEKAHQDLLNSQASRVRLKPGSLASIRSQTLTRQFGPIAMPGMVSGGTSSTAGVVNEVRTPALTRASSTEGAPAEWITLFGSNFSGSCAVRCELSPGNTVNSPEVRFRSATEISFRVPEFTGDRASSNGRIFVTAPAPGNRTLTSAPLSFLFKQAQPVVTAISGTDGRAEGEPGTLVLITGSGFTRSSEVYFQVDASRIVVAQQAEGSTDSELLVVVPGYEGITGKVSGYVSVKNGSSASARTSFDFKPEIVTLYASGRAGSLNLLTLPGAHYITSISPNDEVTCGMPLRQGGISVLHDQLHKTGVIISLDLVPDESDLVQMLVEPVSYYEDVLFDGGSLINNWVLDGITLEKEFDVDDVSITESHANTGNLRIVVKWDHNNGMGRGTSDRAFRYGVNFVLKGPKGTPYR